MRSISINQLFPQSLKNVTQNTEQNTEPVSTVLNASDILVLSSVLTLLAPLPFLPHLLLNHKRRPFFKIEKYY